MQMEAAAQAMQQAAAVQGTLQMMRLQHLSQVHCRLLEATLAYMSAHPGVEPIDAEGLAQNAVRIGDALLVAAGVLRKL